MKSTSSTTRQLIATDTGNTEKLGSPESKDVQISSSEPRIGSAYNFSSINKTSLITRHTDCPFDIPDIVGEMIKYPSLQLLSTTKALRALWDTIKKPDWLRVILTLDDLSNNDNEKLQFAQKDQIKIKIKNIQTAEDAQKVIDFIQNPKNTAISALIDALEFGNINDDNYRTIQELLNLIASKAIITLFSCGDITDYAHLKIPFDQLISFTCGKIENATLKLPKKLNELTSFTCGQIYIATLKLPRKLNELISFTCGDLHSNWPIKLPIELNKLKFIFLQDIEMELTFPEKLDNLTTFSCVAIWSDTTLTFPEKLDNLTSFSAEVISGRVIMTLPKKLPKLECIACEEINSPDIEILFDEFKKAIKEKAAIKTDQG